MKFEFEGNIHDYQLLVKGSIHNYNQHFINAWSGTENLKLRKVNNNTYHLKLSTHQILKSGDVIDPDEHDLVFNDGSIFSFAQTIKTIERNKCIIDTSVVYFAKVIEQKVEYIFHYDKVNNIPNHPDYHLQFDYDQSINTPRFEINSYVSISDVLEMIIRDKLL